MTAKHQLNSKLAWPVCTKNTKLKQNGTGAMTQFFIELWHEHCYLGDGGGARIKFLVGESLLGGIFLGGGGISKFLTGEGGLPPIPSVEKTLPDILYKCHKVNKDDIKFKTKNLGR